MAEAGVNAPESAVCALIDDIFGALGFTADERAVSDRDPAWRPAARAITPTG